MDENTWRFAQLMMWIVGLQTTVLLAAIGFVWNNLSKRMDNFETSMSKIDSKIIELDKRLFGIETLLHLKECCLLKEERPIKKVE